ncbi:hypothetical protein KAM466_18480 [Aeromonas caviae]|uniref:glycosyltransferase n=1 Tax=Aeromonas caviae TaxID=648 RepID=UPI001FB9635E|nr:glycosyltransferase [Aeromonas caviae]GKR14530.1 hypothetical protein KAM466_18480 [Aeromonas caviae]
MKFDFIMCVNKDNPFFSRAISSIVEQEYDDDYGIIVVANNCTDEFYLKLQLIAKNTPKIILERTAIGQVAFNLNYAANLSQADYLVRMDADDFSLPNRLKITAEKIKQLNYPDVLSGGVNYIDEQDTIIKKMSFDMDRKKLTRELAYRNIVSHPASALKRTSLISVRGYAGGVNSEDYDLWLRMLRSGLNIVLFPEVILFYRISPYQVKGSSIAYADGIGIKIREFFLTGNTRFLFGFFYEIAKYFYLKVTKKISD